MKKFLLLIVLAICSYGGVQAQTKKTPAKKEVKDTKKDEKSNKKDMTEDEKRNARHEREKERWKRVGNYWKDKHEKKVAEKEAKEKN